MKQYYLKLKAIFRNPIRSKLLFFKHLKNASFKNVPKKQVIICFDGFSQHGGLVDRLKGIISFYEASKLTGFEFKIYHQFPYQLEVFLEPNLYDWNATEADMKWHFFKTKFLYCMLDFKLNPIAFLQNTKNQKIFVYNNIDYLEKIFPKATKEQLQTIWANAFHTLFKKSEFLQQQINSYNLKQPRLAIHSRFTSILGDFIDTNSKVLPQETQKQLFKDLEQAVSEISNEVNLSNVYIFSDSFTYLNYMKKNTNFNILEGLPLHPDNKKGLKYTHQQHAKTFIDFFAMAESTMIILVRKPFMYPSAYPLYASYIYQKPFKTSTIA